MCPQKIKSFLRLMCLLLKRSFVITFLFSLSTIPSRANVERRFSVLTLLFKINKTAKWFQKCIQNPVKHLRGLRK